MDLQLAQETAPYNYNYYNYEVILFVTVLTAFIIITIDRVQIKRLINNETQVRYKLLHEFLQLNNNVSIYEKEVSQLENKIGNINKNINSALEQQMDYINRQLLTQNASIEDVNVKLFHDAEESRAFVSRQIADIKSKVFEKMEEIETVLKHEIEELEEEHTILVNKIEERDGFLLNKIDENNALDKQMVYDMYRYLYFGIMQGSGDAAFTDNTFVQGNHVYQTLKGFFKNFYGFEFDQKIEPNITKMLNETHPYRIKQIEMKSGLGY